MKNFEIITKLGDGAYSVVYKVKRKADDKIYALKKVKLKDLHEKEKQNALNEVRILASVKSNFVISYKEAFIDEDDSNLCLVMEYADKGDLYQKICQFKKIGCLIEEIDIWKIFIQMTKGLKALHDMNILHRDLKSANIFLFSDGTAKIGDLNVSKVVRQGLGYTQTGTPYYASPEVWKDQPYDSKSDIWSLGCVTYEMLALRPPFRAENMDKLYNKVIKGEYGKIGDRYSDDMKEIIKLLLKVNPKERPSCGQILNHNIIQKRLEFFQAQSGFEDELDTNDEAVLIKTIKMPKNIIFLTEKLPEANYDDNNKKNEEKNKVSEAINNNINNINNKATFPNKLLPNIKFNFNKIDKKRIQNASQNNIIIDKFMNEEKKEINNNDDNNNNNNITLREKTKDKNNLKDNNDINEINNNHITKDKNIKLNDDSKKVRDKSNKKKNINISLIPINKKVKHDFINIRINHLNKKPNSSSKKNIFHKDNSQKNILAKIKNDNDNYKIKYISDKNNKMNLNTNDKRENSYSNITSKFDYNNNTKKSNFQQDEFFKYLKSIGLDDMFKLCVPNYIENNSIKNYNNRYKFGNKKANYLPNINNNINNNNKKLKNEKSEENKNKIIPNKRLIPLGNKII